MRGDSLQNSACVPEKKPQGGDFDPRMSASCSGRCHEGEDRQAWDRWQGRGRRNGCIFRPGRLLRCSVVFDGWGRSRVAGGPPSTDWMHD